MVAPAVSATIINSLQGTTEDGGQFPPDPTGAAGPDNIVTGSNSQFEVYSMNDAVELPTQQFYQFFQQPIGTHMFDPHIVYDVSSGRFMMVIDDGANLYLAVSSSSDATGSWCTLQWNGAARGIWPATDWADYPLIGTDTHFVYLTANIFSGTTVGQGTFQFARVLEIDKSSLLSCSGSYNYNVWSNLFDPNTGVLGSNVGDQASFTVSPELDQTPDNPFAGGFLVDSYSGGGCDVTLWTLSGTTVSSSQTLTSAQVGTECYSAPVNAPQQGTTQQPSPIPLDAGDSRVSQVIDQFGTLSFALTSSYNWGCSSGVNDVADWFEISGTNQNLLQDGSFGESCYDFFMPGMQPLSNGDSAVGYEISSSSMFPASAFLSLAGNGTPSSYFLTQVSTGPFTGSTDGGNTARWGDYTGCLLDPTNQNDAWITGEYTTATNNWATWVDQMSG